MFYCKNYMHVRPMRFSILCTRTDGSDKSPIDVLYCCSCLHPKTILMEAGWTTVPCPATNLCILIQYANHLQGQSVISVALKIPLEIRLWICILYMKRHFCIDPMTILVSQQAAPPHFTTKLRPQAHVIEITVSNYCLRRNDQLLKLHSISTKQKNRLPT